ncbi:hypothetical protein H257_19014 [Aphanomyces astaci]|uniref:Uncharacterized protein n=1 Tax=Aphanomyces astaci TaxID=112090 RepID=W4FBH1_APHAT|nr:hypothetical protein H257_19014 [Aphanomyces astaci]ETV64043.1 hypothetical protein H257_19014 [Aphanomyces astaci]|eukprot:XP_009846472.1 hypothetical protein H257_19014 [Aphanomyces astaci]
MHSNLSYKRQNAQLVVKVLFALSVEAGPQHRRQEHDLPDESLDLCSSFGNIFIWRQALTDGHISRFHVIGGCDGYEGERSYYTDLTKALPDTSVVHTVGCYKFRINHLHMGTIGDMGIRRLLDLSQWNDSYSAVQIALALQWGMNDLPLSTVLSYFEQKAVVELLTLLLGMHMIYNATTNAKV